MYNNETYIKRGGFEIQINVVDRQTLEKAKNNPDDYRELIVRIGGFVLCYSYDVKIL